MTEEQSDKLLNVEQASKYLKVHTSTLATWRIYHKGPIFTKGRCKIHYRLSDLKAYAESKGYDLSEGALP